MDNKRTRPVTRRRKLLKRATAERCSARLVTHVPPSLKAALAEYAAVKTRNTGEIVTSGSLVRGWIRQKLTKTP